MSIYPSDRDSWITYQLLYDYINLYLVLKTLRSWCLREKLIKEIIIFGNNRKDIGTDITTNHNTNANSKYRYIILATVTIKRACVELVELYDAEQTHLYTLVPGLSRVLLE